MTTTEGSILGHAVQRREDPTLLRGEDKYYADMDVPGAAYAVFVRSTVAHGRILSIDTEEAEAMPGVIAVHTAKTHEMALYAPVPLFPPYAFRPPLATEKVRFVGDIYAVVVAETRLQAIDAAELVWADIESLPAVIGVENAAANSDNLLFEEHGSNVVFETGIGLEDDPLAGATHITEIRMESQRLAGVPIEPNGAIAIPEDEKLTLWIPSQNPIAVRDALAPQLGMEPENIRVAAPAVGGGFGPKAGLYTEHIIVCSLARDLGRPVRWTEERTENMLSLAHGRGMVFHAKLGTTDDGTIVGLEVENIADCGAYAAVGTVLTTFTQTMIQGVYAIPKIKYHALSVVTNTTFTAAYRGAGRPEATQLLERIIDKAADELGIDPAEIRRKNFLQPDDFPLTTLGGANYDCGEYEKTLDMAMDKVDYAGLLTRQSERRSSGDAKQIGIGIGSYVEVTAPAGLHVEFGAVEVGEDGKVTARVGTSAHGQGHITAFSMIVSDMLGVPMEDVTILQSDTDHIPRGQGTMGSRSLQTAGSAVHVASETVLEKAKSLASHLLEADAADIVVGDGGLHVAGVPANGLKWADLAKAANDDAKRPEGMEPGLAHELDFDGTDSTFPFGTHIAVVEVDTDTGNVELLKIVAVDDCGKILNPLLVTGQQHGGIAQGAAQALFEHVRYDDDGNPITSNLADYSIPAASEFPSFDTYNTETPTPRNPLGAKGIGESGTIGSTPAIHNAVVDAVSHLGVTHIEMPLAPQTVWAAIQEAR